MSTAPADGARPESFPAARASASPYRALFSRLVGAGVDYCLLKSGDHWGRFSDAAAAAVVLIPGPGSPRREVLAEAGFRPLRRRLAGPRGEYVAFDAERERLVVLEVWSTLAASDLPDSAAELLWEQRLIAGAVADPAWPALRLPGPGDRTLLPAVLARAEARLARSRADAAPTAALERGVVVAVVGADGAGKSTAAARLVGVANGTLDAEQVYLGSGSGSGPCAWFRWPMVLGARVLRRIQSSASGAKPAVRRGFWPIWALALAQEKMQKLSSIERARERGAFVVCERYPQCEITGQSDGPLLDHWRESSWRLLRALARWERRPYERARASPPDLVVKLCVDERTALARRPELAADLLRQGIRAVEQISFGEGVATRVIDANQSLAAALAAIQIGVWSSI